MYLARIRPNDLSNIQMESIQFQPIHFDSLRQMVSKVDALKFLSPILDTEF